MKNGDYAVLDVFLITGLETNSRDGKAGAGRESDSVQNPLLASARPSTNRKSVREGVPPV